jgi:tetratricopeptide (TPR) repeat protein
LTKQGSAGEALTHYQQAVRVFPTAPIFHDRLAKSLAHQEKFDRAIVEFRETLRLAPSFLPARIGLANALLAGGEAAEAVDQCRVILGQEPNVTEAIVILGMALAAEGKAEEAIPPLKRALEREPQNARVHFRLGLALYDLGRHKSAVAHLDEAVRLQPDSVPMLWQSAWILATNPDPAGRDGLRAVGLAQHAIQLSGGQDARAFDALAAALAETGEFSAAVDVAEQASAQALARGDAELVDAIEQRLRQYRQGLPYRQPPSTRSRQHSPRETAE